jgi:hypothetical protein
MLLSGDLKLYAQRWAEIFQINQTRQNCTKILRKVKWFKIQVTTCYMQLMTGLQYLSPYFYCVINAVITIFVYFDFFIIILAFFVIYIDCKCRFDCNV